MGKEDTKIKKLARYTYHNRSNEIKDFQTCVIIDNSSAIVVTQSIVLNSYYEYVYHPKIGLCEVTEDISNITCKAAIDYLSGKNIDIKKERKKIVERKKSKRTKPTQNHSKTTMLSKKSKRTK